MVHIILHIGSKFRITPSHASIPRMLNLKEKVKVFKLLSELPKSFTVSLATILLCAIELDENKAPYRIKYSDQPS